MFEKILIANRGEIALRVMKTCKKLGIKSVVVFEVKDKNAAWYARQADEAYEVDSYKNGNALIDIARKSGAQAVHPGYGFLAESAEFADACRQGGLAFVGPHASVIETMGDKINALGAAKRAGLPTLPRSGEISEKAGEEEIKTAADRLGYPLIIKPSAGGGGLGMTIVHSQEGIMQDVERSRSVSLKQFGNGKFYFEKYLPDASHIEVQVLGDHFGNLLHFFERDCSVQRRNQKIVEEAPTPKLSRKQKKKLYAYALSLAREVGYTNAGTIEFIASSTGEVFFLEMNTRIQVEHPITEMITGVDLIALQLSVSSGAELPVRQEEIKTRGHAIEVRIYPELPRLGEFIHQLGSIKLYELPEEKLGTVRVDSALFEGYSILLDYEPLMAKLICRSINRPLAIIQTYFALKNFGIVGVHTNIRALMAIITRYEFINGSYKTRLLSDKILLDQLAREENDFAHQMQLYLGGEVRVYDLVKLEADRMMRANIGLLN